MLTISALAACSQPFACSGGVYRGDCIPGPVVAETPPNVSPPPAPPAPAAVTPPAGNITRPAVKIGDPGDFADVDDKQCKSYGLSFGTRDYADCRIRLSAQHRGLDPNIGVSTPGPGAR